MTIPDDKYLGDALDEASRDLRPVNLWERLREPTAEIAAVHARRNRLQLIIRPLTWAAAVAAVLVITGATFLTLNRVSPGTSPAPTAAGRVVTAQPGSLPPAFSPNQAIGASK